MERDNTGWNGDKGRIFHKRDRCTGYAEKHNPNSHKHIKNRVVANTANACEYGYTDFATHRAACNRNSASIASDCTTHIGFTAFGFTGRTKCTARAYSAYQCSSAFADTDSTGGVACYHSAYTNNSAFADADYTGGFACTHSVGKCNRANTDRDYTISIARAYSVGKCDFTDTDTDYTGGVACYHSAYTDDFTVGNADCGRNFTDIYKSA